MVNASTAKSLITFDYYRVASILLDIYNNHLVLKHLICEAHLWLITHIRTFLIGESMTNQRRALLSCDWLGPNTRTPCVTPVHLCLHSEVTASPRVPHVPQRDPATAATLQTVLLTGNRRTRCFSTGNLRRFQTFKSWSTTCVVSGCVAKGEG